MSNVDVKVLRRTLCAAALTAVGLIPGRVHARPLSDGPAPRSPIVNGTDAAVCGWPSAVALMQGDSPYCTGTLVHPQVVLTAAHCLDPEFAPSPPSSIAFGEDSRDPEGMMTVDRCEFHPDWNFVPPNDATKDLGYCVLDAPVAGVPRVPVLMGCEADTLQVGASLTIVGFGATRSTVVSVSPNQNTIEGVGPKRVLEMSIEQLFAPDEILLSTPTGGGCSGDSGGPAMIRLSDGSWRVVGAASRRNIPPNFDPMVGDELCPEGLGLFYGLFHVEMAWFETGSGFDLTPCHDADGTWNPGPDCDAFPTDPGAGGGAWADACSPTPVGGEPGFCEDPPPDTGTEGGDSDSGSGTSGSASSSTGTTTSTTTGTSSTGTSTGESGTSSGDSGSEETGPLGEGSGEEAGSGSEGTSGAEGGSGKGCDCRSGGAPGLASLVLGLVGMPRRRRARIGSSAS